MKKKIKNMPRKKSYYVIPSVVESCNVFISDTHQQSIHFSLMEDGCVGVLRVFTNKKKAQKACPKGMKPLQFHAD